MDLWEKVRTPVIAFLIALGFFNFGFFVAITPGVRIWMNNLEPPLGYFVVCEITLGWLVPLAIAVSWAGFSRSANKA